jgi:hypothetical protein
MKNLAISALLGLVSAEQIMKIETNVTLPEEPAVIEKPLEYDDEEVEYDDEEVEYDDEEETVHYDTKELCANFVKDFAKQPDWWLLGPEGGLSKLDIT